MNVSCCIFLITGKMPTQRQLSAIKTAKNGMIIRVFEEYEQKYGEKLKMIINENVYNMNKDQRNEAIEKIKSLLDENDKKDFDKFIKNAKLFLGMIK